jgi:D-glycero-alpha-D-manno-heptose-7-phosphate kinase
VTVNPRFDTGIRVAYSRTEEVEHVSQLEHSLVRAALEYLRIDGGVEITTVADIPSRGTGLGSSSSFTVALLHALYAFRQQHVSSERLAAEACHIEIDICSEPIGKQDQYAAALGGFNLIEFRPDGTVVPSPVICSSETLQAIQSNLLLLYTGVTRSASSILLEQAENLRSNKSKRDTVKRMVGLCYDLREEIQRNHINAFGELLHESWLLKKSLTTNISNLWIDECYELARKQGAIGGKILGAGAGGFLLFYAPQERHASICHVLTPMRRMPFSFEPLGSRIIFYNPN